MRLGKRQRAAPRADPERFCLHPLYSVVTGVLVNGFPSHRNQRTGFMVPFLRILGIETSCDE
ncbi:hypothetical protein ACC771_02905, partial [Rhizobium ruizarguesonis]